MRGRETAAVASDKGEIVLVGRIRRVVVVVLVEE